MKPYLSLEHLIEDNIPDDRGSNLKNQDRAFDYSKEGLPWAARKKVLVKRIEDPSIKQGKKPRVRKKSKKDPVNYSSTSGNIDKEAVLLPSRPYKKSRSIRKRNEES